MTDKPRTVRVRVAVAVDPSGDWNASGWSSDDGTEAMNIATDTVGDGEARYYLTADLPIPSLQEVAAEVEGG